MFCIECGTKMALQAKFCRQCGTAADVGGAAVNVTKPADPAGKSPAAKVEQPVLAALAAPPSREELYQAVVGEKRRAFYFDAFLALDRDQKASVPWNWGAFFGLSWWLIYRRMWKNAALCYLLLLSTAAVFLWELQSSDSPRLVAGAWLFTWFFMRLIAGGAGTEIYYSHCKKILTQQVKSGGATVQALAQAGGVSWAAPLIFLALSSMLSGLVGWAIMSSNAYHDYETKAQVEMATVHLSPESPYSQPVPSQVNAGAGGVSPAASGNSGHRRAACRPASSTSLYEALLPPCEPPNHQ